MTQYKINYSKDLEEIQEWIDENAKDGYRIAFAFGSDWMNIIMVKE